MNELIRRRVAAEYGTDGTVRYRRIVDSGEGPTIEEPRLHLRGELARPARTPRAKPFIDTERLFENLGELHVLSADLPLLEERRADLWKTAWASGAPIVRLANLSFVSPKEIYRVLDAAGLRIVAPPRRK